MTEIVPEVLPPSGRDTRQERVFSYHYTAKRIHPLAALLLAGAGVGLMVLMLVFFFWLGILALGLSAAGLLVSKLFRLVGGPRR